MERLKELAQMNVGGNFLRFDNGWEFIFQVVNFEPIEVDKEYQGKKAGTKFQWNILLKDIKINNKKIVDYKTEINPEKSELIISQELNNAYTLELPKGATKELAKFIIDNKVKKLTEISMVRKGEKANTTYHFAFPIDLDELENK